MTQTLIFTNCKNYWKYCPKSFLKDRKPKSVSFILKNKSFMFNFPIFSLMPTPQKTTELGIRQLFLILRQARAQQLKFKQKVWPSKSKWSVGTIVSSNVTSEQHSLASDCRYTVAACMPSSGAQCAIVFVPGLWTKLRRLLIYDAISLSLSRTQAAFPSSAR